MNRSMLRALGFLFVAGFAQADETAPDAKTTTEQFGDWQMLCNQVADSERCRISQVLTNTSGQTVSVLNVFKDANGKRVVELALPLMVDLLVPPTIRVDDQESTMHSYNLCNAQACFALIGDDALIEEFKAGQSAVISFKPVSAVETVQIGYSLKGFSRALQALQSK
ncbi:MAG: invasion associated locus B family protein [Oceanospirillaceae bacterium]|nr:invasion associated locus B family protein [Oceanospirillaceae bacterium]